VIVQPDAIFDAMVAVLWLPSAAERNETRYETMSTQRSSGASVLSRRDLLRNGVTMASSMAALTAFAPVTAAATRKETTRKKETKMTTMTTSRETAPHTGADAIRPFHFKASDEQLADLKRRIAATRWPEKETVADDSQGVQLATVQALARYWATD